MSVCPNKIPLSTTFDQNNF